MPRVGERSAHGCPDCGQPMHWTESAVRNPDLLARSARGVTSAVICVDAYRCASGHTSQECSVCGSYDTMTWRDADGLPHYHVICDACGNDSVTQE